MSDVLDRPRIIAEPSKVPGADTVLTEAALDFLAELHERFDSRRLDLLEKREERQDRFDAGELPDFPPDSREIRDAEWTVGAIPNDLLDRRVEITGPTNAKMLINALNSGAQAFMADFEDATSPTWDELVQGQVNLRHYWNDRLDYVDPETLKQYKIGDKPAVLMVRPRGWHLPEDHVTNYTDLPEITLQQIQHFFEHYKDLEPGKWVKVVKWGDATEAKKMLMEAIERARA